MEIIEKGVDSLGREMIEINGMSFTKQKIIPFNNWLKRQKTNMNDLMNLSLKERELIFLRWKWGLSDAANESLENTEQHILFMIKDWDLTKESDEYRFHFEHKRNFNRICYEIKKQIGLAELPKDENIEKIKSYFGADEA